MLFDECENCGYIVSNEEMIETADGYVCHSCFENLYHECPNCENYHNENNCIFYEGDYYCEDCYHDIILNNFGIHQHDYKPFVVFNSCEDESEMRENTPHIGVELEIQGFNRDEFCKRLMNLFTDDFFYLKLDGSLDDAEGVEIVSQPMTYHFIKNMGYWKTVFNELNKYNMNNTNNCGLHFHIDRNYCHDNLTVATIDYIVNHFAKYFEKIGGRPMSDCATFYKTVDKNIEDYGKGNWDRYCAVNLSNSNTIELRFCKSTYNFKTFMNRVKMVFAIIAFAKTFKFNNVNNWSEAYFISRFNWICKKEFGSKVDIF